VAWERHIQIAGETQAKRICYSNSTKELHRESDVRSMQEKKKDFSKVIHCSKNVIHCERRSSQCTSTSQFGDPKTDKRKNKRKAGSRCVKELKSARSVLYGGGIAHASRFGEKHVPKRKEKGKKNDRDWLFMHTSQD
jgi:hypothetical protein